MRCVRVRGDIIPVVSTSYHLEAQGSLLKVSRRGDGEGKNRPGASTRGNVTAFSRKSRKRLLDLFARLKWDGRKVTFVTLTFSGSPSHEEAYKAFRRFAERLRRRHPLVAYVWRKELQERGSIHFHLLIFDMPYYPQASLQNVWTECTGEDRSIVDIRLVKSKKQMTAYVSKYVAKVQPESADTSLESPPYPHAAPPASSGRWWGCHNRDLLPWAELLTMSSQDDEAVRHLRWAMDIMSHGRCSSWDAGATLYTDEAYNMFRWFERHYFTYVQPSPWNRVKWNGLKHGSWHSPSTCNSYPTPPDAVGESAPGVPTSEQEAAVWGSWGGRRAQRLTAGWLACRSRRVMVR